MAVSWENALALSLAQISARSSAVDNWRTRDFEGRKEEDKVATEHHVLSRRVR